MIFLVILSGEMIFLFHENIILFFRRKMKDDLSQKKFMEIWYFLQMPQKVGLSKKNQAGTWPFLYYLEIWYFIPRKHDAFFLDGKWKMIFLQKYMEILYFLYVCTIVTNMKLPFCEKNLRWSSPKKIHLKVIDIHCTKNEVSIKDFFSKCDQIRS